MFNNNAIVQEGFIPHSYCAPVNTQLAEMAIKKKLPRDQSLGTTTDLLDGDIPIDNCDDTVSGLMGLQSSLKHSQASLNSEPDFLPFAKDPSGRYIVLYTFIARDENDVSVERGEFVTGKRVFLKCKKICEKYQGYGANVYVA